jgi:hypothetical protein
VHKHFTTALQTVTSAGQLGTAIQTLSLCVRPLLIAGLPLEPAGPAEAALAAAAAGGGAPPPPASEEQRAAAAQALAEGEAALWGMVFVLVGDGLGVPALCK